MDEGQREGSQIMKISRLSPRYEVELIELADSADRDAKASPVTHDDLRASLREIAKALRAMVDDNERFLNS